MRFPLSKALAGLLVLSGLAAGPLDPAGAERASHRHPDDRLPALVTVSTPDYDFELVVVAPPDPTLAVRTYVRRTDDVGNVIVGEPDPHGAVSGASWDARGGKHCVTVSGGRFSFPGAPDHAFSFGLAGRDVRRVEVVLADGTRIRTTTTTAQVGRFRAWMLERPLVDPLRVEGFDRRGRLVATVEDFVIPGFLEFGQASTCRRFSFLVGTAQ